MTLCRLRLRSWKQRVQQMRSAASSMLCRQLHPLVNQVRTGRTPVWAPMLQGFVPQQIVSESQGSDGVHTS